MQSIYEKFHSQTYGGSKDTPMELKETPGADLESGKAPDSPTESSSLIESIVNRQIKNRVSKATTQLQSRVSEALDSGRSYKYFFIFLGIGAGLIALSFFFLMFPGKFVLLFTLGSICLLLSMAFLQGPATYMKKLFSHEKMVFTITYLVSIVFSLYATLIAGSTILTLIACAVEMISLSWFMCSSVPGGTSGLKILGGQILNTVRGIFRL